MDGAERRGRPVQSCGALEPVMALFPEFRSSVAAQDPRTSGGCRREFLAASGVARADLLGFSPGARIASSETMEHDEDIFLMRQLAPGNIVGVHNYCDSWCDRCGFARRCVVNMSRPREPERTGADPLLDHLKERFDEVRTLVARRSTFSSEALLKDLTDPGAEDLMQYRRSDSRRGYRRRNDPILREAQSYSGLARAWMDAEADGLRAHADGLVRRAQVENVDEISLIELSRILDAVEIVRHDCFLIFMKLHRAVDGFEDRCDAGDDDPIQNDYNGSAKLALTCIDRSEGAWRAIDRWYPTCRGAAALADRLAALRTAVEQRLPYARAFLRPGFDGVVTPH
jgi:hypothetical protein